MTMRIIVCSLNLLLMVGLISCGGGDGTPAKNVSNNPTKYLAKNIVFETNGASTIKSSSDSNPFDFNLVQKAFAQADNVDTETQIMAKDVIFENAPNSKIESDNVQDALEEISLIFSDVIVGKWSIVNLNYHEVSHAGTGLVEIYDDGTFDLIEGSFAAIGEGSSGLCTHVEDSQTYEFHTDSLATFTHLNGGVINSVIPLLISMKKDEIVLYGGGGCGAVGKQRVSILTRVVE